jgi:predicted phosphodiesterase
MIYAIFSDIHGNFTKLSKMLRLLSSRYQIHQGLCCGDSLGTPPDYNLFADIIFHKLKAQSVKGNSDRKILEHYNGSFPMNSPGDRAYSLFKSLKEDVQIAGESIAITHGSVYSDNTYTRTIDDAKEEFDWMITNGIHFLFHGHTHVPGIIAYDPGENSCTQYSSGLYTQPFRLNKERYYLINPGSVGKAKQNLKEGFAVFDAEALHISFVRL